MKLFVFTDIHGDWDSLKRIKKTVLEKDPELILCAGDISVFEQNIEKILLRLNKLGKKVFLIHGNHESGPVLRHLCSRYENIVFLHKKLEFLRNFCFVGFGGGGFSFVEPDFKKFIEKKKDKLINKKIVLLVHQPPYMTKLDKINSEHAGNKSFREFIVNFKPVLVVCGHLHENEEKQDSVKTTKIINPGPYGKMVDI